MSKYFDNKELNFLTPEVKENGRHMIMTNVQQEYKTKYVNIDTRFQDEYNMQQYADVTFKLPQQINNVKSIKITNIELPFSFYPFSLRRRNTFFRIIQNNTTTHNVLFQDMSYTEETITNDISFAMTSIDPSFCFVYDPFTFKTTFHNYSTTNQYIISFNVDEYGNDDKYYLKSKLGWCLGFREPSYQLGVSSSIVSEAILNVNPFSYLYVCVDDYQPHNPNSFIAPHVQSYMNSNILARVALDPLTYSFGSLIVANQKCGKLLSDTRTYDGKSDILKLHIQILDEFGVNIDLNKMDFSFTLEIVYM